MTEFTTIFALATAPGRGGIGVFRISGPDAHAVITRLCHLSAPPKPRTATLCKIYHPHKSDVIDQALLLAFEAPHSFTGEDVVELHVHGGRAVAQAVTEALGTLPNFRMAEPGEFTRRAFENGKLDLTEAEAIADLVQAETEVQRRQALIQLQGALSNLYEDWRARLIKTLAYLEASIDFSDDDLPKDVAEKQRAVLQDLVAAIATHLDDRHRGERLRDGFSIALLGPPNAGKSSLLNALARRDAAIVSSVAGTTRDVIEIHLDLGGYPVIIADTAGLRSSADAIESEGMRRALSRAEHADLKVLVFDGAVYPALDATTLKLADANTITVLNKIDLVGTEKSVPRNLIPLSAQTGAGVQTLLDLLIEDMEIRLGSSGAPPLTRARHRAALEDCLCHLQRALVAKEAELRAEDVRLAMRALGRITGRVDVEDLLDIIFRDFCIGK